MNAIVPLAATTKYARCIAASKAVRWDIDNDVIKGRRFDVAKKYLPDGLSLVQELVLSEAEMRFASQIQGRTYANVFGLVERLRPVQQVDVDGSALSDRARVGAPVQQVRQRRHVLHRVAHACRRGWTAMAPRLTRLCDPRAAPTRPLLGGRPPALTVIRRLATAPTSRQQAISPRIPPIPSGLRREHGMWPEIHWLTILSVGSQPGAVSPL